jgi:hypothetical protein
MGALQASRDENSSVALDDGGDHDDGRPIS